MNRFTYKSVLALLLMAWVVISVQGQTSTVNAPPLDVSMSVSPERIFLKGIGNTPEEAEVTLSLMAPTSERMPTDLIIAVDTSATVNLSQMTSIGVSILDQATAQDRIGLVSFATNSKVEIGLTDNRQAIEDGFKQLRNLGRTAIGEGIFTAVNELVEMGRAEANWAVILLTDGRSNTGRPVLAQAQRAADNGVKIFTIGVGRGVDRAVMSEIAKLTRGEFYEKFADSVPRAISRSFDQAILAHNVKITQILPAELTYETATENPPTRITQNSNRTTTLEWNLAEVRFSTEWKSVFTVSGSKEGTFSLNARPSKLTYNDFRGRKVDRDLPETRLRVSSANRAPVAGFDFTPNNPSTNDEVSFIDQSSDSDGGIVSWHWDFGDGVTSTQASPTHKYAQDGNYTVSLTVTDADGLTHIRSKPVKVETLKVTVTREISTSFPMDETLPEQTFSVTIKIRVNQRILGLGIEENLPDKWQIASSAAQDSSGGFYKSNSLRQHQWIFNEDLSPGTDKTITYTVELSPGGSSGKIVGRATSLYPAFETIIQGESGVTVATKMPFRILLSRWDTSIECTADTKCDSTKPTPLKLNFGDRLSQDQVLRALAWWQAPATESDVSKKLPGYFNAFAREKLNFQVLQELIAYWLTDTSVQESLPSGK